MQAESNINLIVIDALKPSKPTIIEVAQALCTEKCIVKADIVVEEVDRKTESIKITLEGKNIDFDHVKKVLEDYGIAIHSIDRVVVGTKEHVVK